MLKLPCKAGRPHQQALPHQKEERSSCLKSVLHIRKNSHWPLGLLEFFASTEKYIMGLKNLGKAFCFVLFVCCLFLFVVFVCGVVVVLPLHLHDF